MHSLHPTSTNSSYGSQSSTASRDTALQGATAAFARPKPITKPSASTLSSGSSRAVALQPNLNTTSRPHTSERIANAHSSQQLERNADRVGDKSSKSNGESVVDDNQLQTHSSHLNVPQQPPSRAATKSPSEQAASLAAARAPAGDTSRDIMAHRAANVKRPAAPPKPRRLSSLGGVNDSNTADLPTDDTPIAATTSLVDLFERKASTSQSSKSRPEPVVIKPSKDLPLDSPKPMRNSSGITSVIQMQVEDAKASEAPVSDKSSQNPLNIHKGVTQTQTNASAAVPPGRVDTPTRDIATSTSQRGRSRPESTSIEPAKSPSIDRGRPAASPSPLRHSTTDPIPILMPRVRQSTISPTERFSPSSASAKSLPAQYNLLHPRRPITHMTGDQLANAMVASSLASSRQASPARSMEPPPLPTRRHKQHTFGLSRTPSPSKHPGLRKTLRAKQSDESGDDDDDEGHYHHGKRKVQKHIGKHPNKHHEGDRKRWRETVTERERKRYEGVWAANKGLYSSFSKEEYTLVTKKPNSADAQDIRESLAEQVSNLIARDIWSRSRLADTVLENVWDLVDNRQVGRLNREEFVVGMWLIDGRLKGKKLPVKVSDSVWRSVKGLQGIRIRS